MYKIYFWPDILKYVFDTMTMEYVIGIDVGTESVRGALVDKDGKIRKMQTENITIWCPQPDFYQQSSDEIWLACCKVIKVGTYL